MECRLDQWSRWIVLKSAPTLRRALPNIAASESQRLKEVYEFGPFRVDPEKEILLRGSEPVPLTPKTFQILLVLVRGHKEVVTKDDLMKAVWPDTFVEEANLSRNMFMLRKALGESPQDHQYILTVPGRGYCLAEDVRLVPAQELSTVAAQRSKVSGLARHHSSICLQGDNGKTQPNYSQWGGSLISASLSNTLLSRFGTRCWACIQMLRDQHGPPCCPRSGPRVFVGQIHQQGYSLVSIGSERSFGDRSS